MPRRWLILLGLAGLAVLIPSLATPFVTGNAWPVGITGTMAWAVPGSSFLIVGWIAAWRRPHSRIGLLMMAVGLLWFATGVSWIPDGLAWSAGWALQNTWAPVLAHVFVSFPSGRLRARRDRQVITLTYAWYVLSTLANTLTWHPVPPWGHNVFGVLGNQHLNDEIGRVTAVVTVVVVALLMGTVISHWRRATPPGRRVLAPVLWASVPTGVWYALQELAGAGLLGGAPGRLVSSDGSIAAAALPFGFLIGLLRTRLGRGAVGDLVVELGGRAAPAEHLDAALARVLGDPAIRILYRVPSGSGGLVYVDAAGQPAPLPEPGTGRAVTTVDQGGEPVGRWSMTPRWPMSPSCWRPRWPRRGWPSRTPGCRPRSARSWNRSGPRGRGSCGPATWNASGSSGTCTTARSSGCWRCRSRCAWPSPGPAAMRS